MALPLVEMLLFSRDKWRDIINGDSQKALSLYLEQGGEQGARIAEEIGLVAAFDVANPEVQAWLQTYHMKFADKISATAADRFREVISAGLDAGDSMNALAQRILDDPVVGTAGDAYRAEMIARTESARASVQGELQSIRMSNDSAVARGDPAPFTRKVWETPPDACDWCQAMDGTTIDVEGSYFAQGDTMEIEAGNMTFNYESVEGPPLHPNCRCATTYEIAEEYR